MSHSHGSSTSTQPDPASIAAGHEVTDAHAKPLVIFGIALIITIVITVFITIGLFELFTNTADQNAKDEYITSPLTDQRPPSPAPAVQPAPGLHETLPFQDAAALKAEQDRLSGTYGTEPMADHAEHARMPIKAAIAILADQGIPQGTATDIPSPMGAGLNQPTPYSDGGRGASTGKAAAPGVPQQ